SSDLTDLVRRARRAAARPEVDAFAESGAGHVGPDGRIAAHGERPGDATTVPRRATTRGHGHGVPRRAVPDVAVGVRMAREGQVRVTGKNSSDGGAGSRLRAEGLTLAYDDSVVARDLGVAVPDGSFTVIVGPNACGKSTLLKALARMLRPTTGAVYLDGQIITSYRSREVARRLGLLPQSSIAPNGITVGDL